MKAPMILADHYPKKITILVMSHACDGASVSLVPQRRGEHKRDACASCFIKHNVLITITLMLAI